MHRIVKRVAAVLLLCFMLATIAACGNNDEAGVRGTDDEPTANNDAGESGTNDELTFGNVRIAFIHVGGPEDRGYTYRQHQGTLAMMAELNISDNQVRNFNNIAAGEPLQTALQEAIDWGADIIFGTSFGFGPFMLESARENPDIQFFHATGNLAYDEGLPNFRNYFGNMSQARYLSGIAAGLRTETNILGFVAAHPNGEVITGMTAFFLGARSVNPDVRMYVSYMGVWNNPVLEAQIAQALIDRGADVIAQHADSTAAQTTAQAAGVWSVGYNNDMIPDAPDAVLVSPMFDWSIYLIPAVRSVVENNPLPLDFLAGLNEGMVLLSDLNPNTVAPGTAEAIAVAEVLIRDGRNIFTGPLYGYYQPAGAGEDLVREVVQLLADGDQFIERLSAPSWRHIIEGITIID